MKDLLDKVCGVTAPPREVGEKIETDVVAFGGSKPQLRPEVEARKLSSASGEPYASLWIPGGSEPVNIPADAYEVCLNLDGETTIQEALHAALEKGHFPAGLEESIHRLYAAGILEDTDGGLSRCFRVYRGDAAAEADRNCLWGLEIPGPPLDGVAKLLRPLTGLLTNAYIFWLLMALGFCSLIGYGRLVATGDTSFLPAGPHVFWGKLIGLWFFANLASILRAAACTELNSRKDRILGWKIFLGIPFLSVNDESLAMDPWALAMTKRLSGVALLWTIGTLVVVWIWLTTDSKLDEFCVILASTSFLIGLLQLSPWWKSPLRDSVQQAVPEVDYPWDCWNFFWKGLFRSLFGSQPLGKRVTALLVGTLFLIGWTLLAFRVATFLIRHAAVQLYLDAGNAESATHGWLLMIAAVAIALFAVLTLVNVILLFVFRALRGLGQLSLWDAHRNLFSTFLVLGIVLALLPFFLPAHISEAARWISFFLLYLLLGFFFAFTLKPDLRSCYSSAFLVLVFWSFASALSLLMDAVSGATVVERTVQYARWPVFFPVAAVLLFVDTARRGRTERIQLWPAAVVCVLILEVGKNFNPGPWEFALSFGLAAVLLLLWGMFQAGGWYRRLTYYFAGVLALLMASAFLFGWIAKVTEDRPSRLLTISPGLLGLSLLLVVPLTYRFLLERKPQQPAAPSEDLPGSDREALLQGVNHFWRTVQERIAFIAGEPIAASAGKSAFMASRFFRFEDFKVEAVDESATDLAGIAEDLDRSFAAACRTWLAVCGQKGTGNAATVAYLSLDWQRREILAQHFLRPGGWWTSLLPDEVRKTSLDPKSFFKNKPVFSQLSVDKQEILLANVKLQHYHPGERVVKQGELKSQVFVVADGHAEVVSDEILHGPRRTVLRREDHFGQTSFLANKPQSATVRALDDLWVFRLDRNDVLEAIPDIAELTPSGIAERKISRLTGISFFKDLPGGELCLLAERARYVEFAEGDGIITEGETGEHFYAIDEGSVEVTRGGEKVADLGAGEYFGEIALLLEVPRTASVTAKTNCRCVEVSSFDFKRLASASGFRSQVSRVAKRRAT